MKERQSKAKPLQRRSAAAPAAIHRAPTAGAQRGLGNARLGAMPESIALSRIEPQIIRRESDGDEGLLRYRGGAGERGIGVLYVKNWNNLTTEQQEQVKNFAHAMDIEAASGLTRQQVTAANRRAANQVAGVARIALQLGPDTAAGHIPDVGAGGSILGPISGKPKQVNLSFGGQLNRYRPGFVFTGFTVYDFESGQLIYTSGRHFDEPATMTPGPPPRGLAGPGAAASGAEVASKGRPRTGAPVPVASAPRASSLKMLPPSMPVLGPSARGQAVEAGGLLVLSGLNALLNWLGGNRQSERAAQAGAEIMPAISKHLKENPKDGVLIVAFYHQVKAHPDSLIVPGPVFSHLEYEFGETREKALENFKSKPSLRPYYPNESDVRQFSWLPPATTSLVMPQLEVGRIDDPVEHEAEAVADRVMRMPAGGECCPACAGGEACAAHAPIERGAKRPAVRRFAADGAGGLAVPQDLEPAVRRATSGGEPLPQAVRASFEPRFGEDLSHVRIHRDATAAESATALGARAYTRGEHIAFASGRWAPGTDAGDRLIAHELTHVLQQGSSGPVRRYFVPEQAAEEMVGKTFSLNAAVELAGTTFPKGTNVVVARWQNDRTLVEVSVRWSRRFVRLELDKKYLVPALDGTSGLPTYRAGVAGVEKQYAALERKIRAQEKKVSDWKLQEANYRTPRGRVVWQRQMDAKDTEFRDLKYKLTGEGYTAATVPERLQKTVGRTKVPVTPQSVLLNRALIEETMFNAFDANIVNWVAFYNRSIGGPKKWPALDPGLVKSLLYQESHMGTQGRYLLPPPYNPQWHPMTRFNIGQTIDSAGEQQIIMIKEISPSIAARYNLDQVIRDMHAAKARRKELAAKGARIDAAEQAELRAIDDRCKAGQDWNHFFTTDPRWLAAVEEFFLETTPLRNLDYDFWIRTTVRWLFEKRAGAKDWSAAIKAYNGSGAKAEIYRKSVVDRRDAARAATKNPVSTPAPARLP